MTSLRKVLAPIVAMLSLVLWCAPSGAAPPIKVDLATPSNGEQGTLDLDVVITGSGFETGAAVDFLVTGSGSDNGNVVVKQVTFHDSRKLTAKVSLENAKLADFDIKVSLLAGRNGKGISLFKVVAKAAGAGNGDRTAPGAISNVSVTPLALALRLTFVAPGDDGFAGTASGYGLEYKAFTGDCAVGDWLPGPNIDNTKPAGGGVLDSVPVQGLSPGATYCVRLRARDEAFNWSPWTELTASTASSSWSSELVSPPRYDELGTRLYAASTRVVGDVDGVTTHVVWASVPISPDSITGRKLTIASGGSGQWVFRDVVRDVVPSRVFVRARPGGGVGVLVLGYVVVARQVSYRVILVETTPTSGGYSLTESVLVEGVGDHASPLAYGPDGTLWFAYQKITQINKKTTVSNVTLRRRDPSGAWSEQVLLSSAVQGPELMVAPDGGLAVAASVCQRTLYGKQDPSSGTWRFYRSAPTTAYVSGHAIAFETSGALSILANWQLATDNYRTVIRYRNANLEMVPVLTSQLPANVSAICASAPPPVEPASPEIVLSQENAAPLGNVLFHAGVSTDDSGTHVRAIRWWNDLPTLLALSDCGNGWQVEAVDIGHTGYSAPWHGDPAIDAGGTAIAAYSPEPTGVGTFAAPASSIRFSKRIGNGCSGPP